MYTHIHIHMHIPIHIRICMHLDNISSVAVRLTVTHPGWHIGSETARPG